jgi:hypothetical protein
MEWGTQSGISFVAQAYTMVERLRPMLADIAGDALIAGCFGWLLDLVTEWTGESTQPYPFLNYDAPQWSGDNASYADVRNLVTAIKLAGARCGLPGLKVGSLHVGFSRIYDIPTGPFVKRQPKVYHPGGYSIDHAASTPMKPWSRTATATLRSQAAQRRTSCSQNSGGSIGVPFQSLLAWM